MNATTFNMSRETMPDSYQKQVHLKGNVMARPDTVTEKFMNSIISMAIARAAMIALPFLVSIFGWGTMKMLGQYDERVTGVEKTVAQQTIELQDHESRLKFSDLQAKQFATIVEARFADITTGIRDMNTQISSISGSIIRLQTTIENRLPPRRASLDPDTAAEPPATP